MLLLILLLCLTCVALVAWGFTGYNRSLRFASLIGASMAGFVVPQVIGLNNQKVLPEGALEMFTVMAILCMACAMLGDLWGFRHPGGNVRRMADYDERRVTEAALILMAVTLIVVFLGQVVYADEIRRRTTIEGGMSGAMVIIIFFTAVHRYGFALALLLYWRRQTALTLAMVLFGCLNYFMVVVMNARRGPAIEFLFIVLLSYAMARRKHIPALLITCIFVGGTLFSTAIGEFRGNDDRDFVEKVEQAEYLRIFQEVLDRGGPEVRNGAQVIYTTNETGAYEYGKIHWNKLVHAYFPGQVFGYETKQGLKFELVDIAEEENRQRGTMGVTPTGMADCFTSFGFFGCLKYLVMGFVMGRWYRRAFMGDLAAQLTYATVMSAALHTISHGTAWFVNDYIHLVVFSYPLIYWARKPSTDVAVRTRGRTLVGLSAGLR